jgi:magnesium chelatase family protein
MLSRGLTTILADMTFPEALEIPRIHRVAGRTGVRTALVTTCPCRAPHQTILDGGVIGGGHVPLPGEGSLVPHGMRFRDARPECRRHRLKVLASRSRMVSCEGPPGL